MSPALARLAPKHARFVAEYLKDLNGTQAAIRAGYKGKAARRWAATLLTKPDISAAIAEAHGERIERLELDADTILRELLRIATSDIGAIFDADGNLKPLKDVPEDVRRAIAGVEVIIKNAEAGDGQTDTVHKYKMWDKVKALELLARHLQILDDQPKAAVHIERLLIQVQEVPANVRRPELAGKS